MDISKEEKMVRELFIVAVSAIKEEQIHLVVEGDIDVEEFVYFSDSAKEIFLKTNGQELTFNFSQIGVIGISLFETVNGEFKYDIKTKDNEELCKEVIKTLVKKFFSGCWHNFVFLNGGRKIEEIVSDI